MSADGTTRKSPAPKPDRPGDNNCGQQDIAVRPRPRFHRRIVQKKTDAAKGVTTRTNHKIMNLSAHVL